MAYGIGSDLVEQALANKSEYETWKQQRQAVSVPQVENISMTSTNSVAEGRKYNFGGATFNSCTFTM